MVHGNGGGPTPIHHSVDISEGDHEGSGMERVYRVEEWTGGP